MCGVCSKRFLDALNKVDAKQRLIFVKGETVNPDGSATSDWLHSFGALSKGESTDGAPETTLPGAFVECLDLSQRAINRGLLRLPSR